MDTMGDENVQQLAQLQTDSQADHVCVGGYRGGCRGRGWRGGHWGGCGGNWGGCGGCGGNWGWGVPVGGWGCGGGVPIGGWGCGGCGGGCGGCGRW